MKSRRSTSPSASSTESEKSNAYSSQSGASMASTQDSRMSIATDATECNSEYDNGSYYGSTSKMSVASMAKTTAGLTRLVQSTIAKLKKRGGCPVKIIKQDLKESHGYTLTGTHNTRRLNTVLKNLQKDGKLMKTAKGYKLMPASELRRRRRHHRHKGKKRRRRRRRGRGRGRRRRKFKRARGKKHRRRRRRRRRRHGRRKGRKAHGRRRRRRRRHGRKHSATGAGTGKASKPRRGVAKLSLKGKVGPLAGGPAKGGGLAPKGTNPPSTNASSRLPSRPASRLQSQTASRLLSRVASRLAYQKPTLTRPRRPSKRAKASKPAAVGDDDVDE